MLIARLMLVKVLPSPGSALDTMIRCPLETRATWRPWMRASRGRLIWRYSALMRRCCCGGGSRPAASSACSSMATSGRIWSLSGALTSSRPARAAAARRARSGGRGRSRSAGSMRPRRWFGRQQRGDRCTAQAAAGRQVAAAAPAAAVPAAQAAGAGAGGLARRLGHRARAPVVVGGGHAAADWRRRSRQRGWRAAA